jgi:hypothetical protein
MDFLISILFVTLGDKDKVSLKNEGRPRCGLDPHAKCLPKTPKAELRSVAFVSQELGHVGGEGSANAGESIINIVSQSFHPSCRGEPDQSNYERVLDQILTTFIQQHPQLHRQLQQFVFHLSPLP